MRSASLLSGEFPRYLGVVSLVSTSLAQIDEMSPCMTAIGVSDWLAGTLAAGLILSGQL